MLHWVTTSSLCIHVPVLNLMWLKFKPEPAFLPSHLSFNSAALEIRSIPEWHYGLKHSQNVNIKMIAACVTSELSCEHGVVGFATRSQMNHFMIGSCKLYNIVMPYLITVMLIFNTVMPEPLLFNAYITILFYYCVRTFLSI